MVLPPDEADAICSVFHCLHAPAERKTMADNVVLDAHQLLRGWQRSPGIHEDDRLLKLFAPMHAGHAGVWTARRWLVRENAFDFVGRERYASLVARPGEDSGPPADA